MDFERFGGSKFTPESARTRGMLGGRCAASICSLASDRSRGHANSPARGQALAYALTRALTHWLNLSLAHARRDARKTHLNRRGRAPCWLAGARRRWTTRVSLGPDSGVLRDQIHTTSGPKVDYVEAG